MDNSTAIEAKTPNPEFKAGSRRTRVPCIGTSMNIRQL